MFSKDSSWGFVTSEAKTEIELFKDPISKSEHIKLGITFLFIAFSFADYSN
ncbi:hypothetical protein KF282_0089 [Lactococcus lactis subsp. lactis]|uniref:Uncharacterized protein n=1 Tax=Lactococcus lactis subsp. lactis TaxID=1360 RepID=A0A0V8D424_LACLL|nr:hypothetical protein KF282_0089 [Lactococcus lactis subsp. lactis]